jgi:hypothetical protein
MSDNAVGDFGPGFVGFSRYDGPEYIETINIKILGARHNDFTYKDYKTDANGFDLPHIPENELWNRNAYEPERIAREINFKTNKFMRELYKASKDEEDLPGTIEHFLIDLENREIAALENDVWVIDARKLPYSEVYAY